MALIKWAKGIDFVSGLLSKRPKKGAMHSDHQNTLLATHRVAETTNPNCTRIYMVGEYNRSTQPSADEMAVREKFAAVARAVALRKKNLSQVATDQANFAAQTQYKTMRSYLWSLESAIYDQNH